MSQIEKSKKLIPTIKWSTEALDQYKVEVIRQ